MVRTFLKVYMELCSSFLFLQEQIKDIIGFVSFCKNNKRTIIIILVPDGVTMWIVACLIRRFWTVSYLIWNIWITTCLIWNIWTVTGLYNDNQIVACHICKILNSSMPHLKKHEENFASFVAFGPWVCLNSMNSENSCLIFVSLDQKWKIPCLICPLPLAWE